jgi:predicted NBD/HSP70 family sugar kinase
LVYVTLSTGVGGAVLIDGKLYRGAGGAHPEPGHQVVPNEFGAPDPVPCACGATNCLEALISGRALERRFGQPPATLPAEVWKQVGRILGHGLRNLATLYAPRRIVLGGGVAISAAAHLLPEACAVLREGLRLVPMPAVTTSVLGYDTAAWGAVALALGYRG